MSSFHLLLLEETLQTPPQPIRKQHKKKRQTSNETSTQNTKVEETEFSKIHLNEIWVVILSFIDTKTQYKSLALVDKLICGILYSIPLLKSSLQRTFSGIISGEEEQDHLPLLNYGSMTLSKRIDKVFSSNDPLNIFGFASNSECSSSESETKYETETIQDIPLTFHNLYIGLLNRRLNITNRNVKLREFLGLGGCLDCPSCYNRKNNKQIHCEHFRILVKHDQNNNYILNLECKSCSLHQSVQLVTALGKIKQFC